MRTTGMAIALSLMLVTTANAGNGTFSKEVKLSKGKAKVEFTIATVEGSPSGPARTPKIGIAPSPNESFGSYLAKRLDESALVVVVPPRQLSTFSTAGVSFEQMMRSELEASVGSSCKAAKLDYLLFLGAPQMSTKTDATAYVFGLGKMRMRNTIATRLYDCRTKKFVWAQSVLFETSQGMMGMVFNGVGALFGGPEAEQAMAGIFADKLTSDLKW